ncbi:tumor necrosis factor receptor superfamily member 1A isoform X2 [Echeneis naucrates]|uniref:Tumor necrosis factor receptor superfamily member 1A-like n=1 Tax=Echeneis naucrates TaxID=173247 RepID=A0A665T6K9_ECHNA|nr:tumor necrosis factor receptor superfamily member 1A-like isoform X2 [Echeneis naucrates]
MDFVLVIPLMIALLFCGQSYSQTTKNADDHCYERCPPGSRRMSSNEHSVCMYTCKTCEENTFMDLENYSSKCRRCKVCGTHQVEKRPCSNTNDTLCECKEGYFSQGSDFCQPCRCEKCKEPNNGEKCQACRRPECASYSACKTKCSANATAVPDVTTSSTFITTPKSVAPPHSIPADVEIHWLSFLVPVLIFVVPFGLVLLYIWAPVRYPNSCPCWGMEKDVKLHHPQSDEHHNQDSNLTTLTLNISEGTPMMPLNLSSDTSQRPPHINLALPNAVQQVPRQDEQSGLCQPIFLYAVIKEVPLRRWKEFLRLLSVSDQEMERVELETGLGLGSKEKQYQMLRLWSQRSTASLNNIISALHDMDLSGCAQLLQENLKKLHWSPEQDQGFTACRELNAGHLRLHLET